MCAAGFEYFVHLLYVCMYIYIYVHSFIMYTIHTYKIYVHHIHIPYVYVHKSDNPANNSEDPRNTKSTCHQTHIPIHGQAQLCTLRSRHANQMPPAIQRVLTKRIKISQGRACMYSNSRSWPKLGTAKSSSQILGSAIHPYPHILWYP